MNKIKIIYDSAKKMKEKEYFKGTFKAEAYRDQEKLFSINDSFEKNNQGDDSISSFHKHHCEAHGMCMKSGCSRLITVLGILSSIKLEEKEDGSAELSLESSNIPQGIRKDIHEMIKHGEKQHRHHMHMEEFHEMEQVEFALNVCINKDSEVERVAIAINGEKQAENNQRHVMRLTAELNLE